MNLNKLKKDENGNIFSGIYVTMIIAVILVGILILNLAVGYNEINTNELSGNSFNYIMKDYEDNIAPLTYVILENITNEIVETKIPLSDSKETIKDKVQEKLNEKNQEYLNNSQIKIETEVLYIEAGKDPFHININTLVTANKDNMSYNKVITSEVSIINLKDPIPALKCGNDPSFSYDENYYYYGNSLSNYLASRNQTNPQYYINASSSCRIKRCPYDPYIQHGNGVTMKNCLDNGYYHESADGSCFFHRFVGAGNCYDYGLEAFIRPNPLITQTGLQSTSASDHVIFGVDSYPGTSIILNTNNNVTEVIFLDSSHATKYGLI
ncbi:MAG: hypothetical protein LBR24_01150 [Methanobrevibacter sp.]|jgi:hypothetical protein|nr:hypothetical protein [Methanobrevibacter sp.]